MQIASSLKSFRRFFIVCLLLIAFELSLSPVLAYFVSDARLLRDYLEQNFFQTYKQTAQFLSGELHIEPDEIRGWRNRPEAIKGNIRFDEYGSRSRHGVNPHSQEKTRMIFLGDSRMLGGDGVTNEQTINAFVETGGIETLNFSSPDYSLDQSFLTMQAAQESFQPDVYVIGIGSQPGRLLRCLFLPFFDISILPRMKPRFLDHHSKLDLLVPPYRRLLQHFPDNPDLIPYLKEHDGLFHRFQRFKKEKVWRMTPFLAFMTKCWKAVSDRYGRNVANPIEGGNNKELTSALLDATRQFAQSRKARLIYIVFAKQSEIHGNSTWYDETIAQVRRHNILFVDTRLLFRQYPGLVDELYLDDLHFSPRGNQIIAMVISHMMERLEQNRLDS